MHDTKQQLASSQTHHTVCQINQRKTKMTRPRSGRPSPASFPPFRPTGKVKEGPSRTCGSLRITLEHDPGIKVERQAGLSRAQRSMETIRWTTQTVGRRRLDQLSHGNLTLLALRRALYLLFRTVILLRPRPKPTSLQHRTTCQAGPRFVVTASC